MIKFSFNIFLKTFFFFKIINHWNNIKLDSILSIFISIKYLIYIFIT